MSRTSPRPWRARAFTPDPFGGPDRPGPIRATMTRAALDRFVDARQAAGDRVVVWEIVPLDLRLRDGEAVAS